MTAVAATPVLLAAAAVALWLLARRGVTRTQLRAALLPGAVLGVVAIAAPTLLFTAGNAHLTAAASGMFGASIPLLTLVIARVAGSSDAVTRRQAAGLAVAASGVVLLLTGGDVGAVPGGSAPLGALLSLLGAAAGAAAYMYGRPVVARHPLGAILLIQLWVGAGVLIGAALVAGAAVPNPATLPVLAGLSVVAFIGPQALTLWALRRYGAVSLATANYAVPIVAGLLAWPLLGEVPTALLVVSVTITVTGCTLVARAPAATTEAA